MEVILAQEAGFCFGVKRALKLVEKALKEYGEVFSIGPLIHNQRVIDELKEKGLKVLDSVTEVLKGPVIIRSHGVTKEALADLKKRNIPIIDGTCPNVKKVQKLAQSLSQKGFSILIIGEKDHAEVKGILSYTKGKTIVIESLEDIPESLPKRKIALLIQTTQEPERVKEILGFLFERVREMNVYNTLCEAAQKRQKEAVELAKKVDLLFVIGGKESANTRRMVEVCKRVQPRTYHIEGPEEIRPELLKMAKKVGVTGGASTPPSLIKKVYERLMAL